MTSAENNKETKLITKIISCQFKPVASILGRTAAGTAMVAFFGANVVFGHWAIKKIYDYEFRKSELKQKALKELEITNPELYKKLKSENLRPNELPGYNDCWDYQWWHKAHHWPSALAFSTAGTYLIATSPRVFKQSIPSKVSNLCEQGLIVSLSGLRFAAGSLLLARGLDNAYAWYLKSITLPLHPSGHDNHYRWCYDARELRRQHSNSVLRRNLIFANFLEAYK